MTAKFFKQKIFLLLSVIAAILLESGFVSAAETNCAMQSLSIDHAEIRATPPNAPVSGGYMMIRNDSSASERLVTIKADFASHVELHEMKHENGVMKMSRLDEGLAIPKGERIILKPGGIHIMFTGLQAQLKAGDVHEVELIFEGCGAVKQNFTVRKNPLGGLVDTNDS